MATGAGRGCNSYPRVNRPTTLLYLLLAGQATDSCIRTKKIKYLEENVAAVNITLTPEEIKEIRKASEIVDKLPGDRYPPG